MGEHPHKRGLEILEDAEEENPTVSMVLDEEGPHIYINTGYTSDAAQAQLNLMATHIQWLAERTDTSAEDIGQEAIGLAKDLGQSPDAFSVDHLSEE